MMESCSAVRWCCVSSLMKMVTFFAGPCDSMLPPLTRRALPSSHQQRAQPNAAIAEHDAARKVQHTHPAGAVANGLIELVFETGERRVSAEDTDHQEQPPVRVGLHAFR